MKKISKGILAAITIGVALFLAFVAYAGYRIVSYGLSVYQELPSKKEIAGPVEIGPDWREFAPQPPLKSSGRVQYVGLKLENVKRWDSKDARRLMLADGTSVLIEVELHDERGNIYSLVPNGIGPYIEFGKQKYAQTEPPNTNEPDFPSDRFYTKIRVRSDKRVSCSQIVWGSYTPL
jgi:hypothetical protein